MRPVGKFSCAALAVSAVLLTGAVSPTSAAMAGPDLPLSARRLLAPEVATIALPARGNEALVWAVGRLGMALGVPLQADPVVAAARLPEATAGRLALLIDGMRTCHLSAEPARAAWRAGHVEPPAPAVAALRGCAASLLSIALETSAHLRSEPVPGGAIDLWPILRYAPGPSDDRYLHDYALIIDGGGHDTYLNNAGGNLLDLQRGPEGSGAPKNEPARGCVSFGYDYPGECFSAVALLIDAAGDDTYGGFEAPDPTYDAFCTADPVVRRINTGGAAFIGVGLLVDGAGNDEYLGKTLALGSGHFAGVGVLRDEAGNDTYAALRNSQGYALASGVGILRDNSGDDVYDYYTAAPLDPGAPFHAPGSGGVVDDQGLCDNLPRQVQGTAQTPGSYGMLHDLAGADRYRGAPLVTQPFFPAPTRHGSQGFGGDGGLGYFLDESGQDTYEGVPGHADDTMHGPMDQSTGFFEDKNSGVS